MFMSIAAISLGASIGAVCRWMLGIALNALHPFIVVGTLTANLIGAYAIGVALAYIAGNPTLSPVWRLFNITGFTGGLTTFSTFSAEVVQLIQQSRFGWVLVTIALHLGGSLLLTALGIGTFVALRQH
jgi:CrcB protein